MDDKYAQCTPVYNLHINKLTFNNETFNENLLTNAIYSQL